MLVTHSQGTSLYTCAAFLLKYWCKLLHRKLSQQAQITNQTFKYYIIVLILLFNVIVFG